MPKKSNSASTSDAANGENPAKKPRLGVKLVRRDTSSGDESDAEEQKSESAQEINDELLKQMAQISGARDKYKNFDFNRLKIAGFSPDQLREQYDRLRAAAFKNCRKLMMKKEVEFVREFSKSAMKNMGEKPKRPPSSYLRFQMEQRRKISEKNPELAKDNKEIVRVIAEKWKHLGPEKKKKYDDAYKQELAQYYQEHPEMAKKPKSTEGKKRAARKLPPPKSAYELFAEAKREEYGQKYDLTGNELAKKLVSKYQSLSDNKRQKWEKRAQEAFEEYVQALENNASSKRSRDIDDDEIDSDPIFSPHEEDPILAKSPVDKDEKPKKKGAVADFLSSVNKGASTSQAQGIKKVEAPRSPSKKIPKDSILNSWLD